MLKRQQYFLMYQTPIIVKGAEGYPSGLIESPTVSQREYFAEDKNARVVVRKFNNVTEDELQQYNESPNDILALDYLRSIGVEYEEKYFTEGYCVDEQELDYNNLKKI